MLDLAADEHLPLLERVRFLSIFAKNLDEFFMVRVAGLKRRIATGLAVPTITGTQPRALLRTLDQHAHSLMQRHSTLLAEEIAPRLGEHDIVFVSMSDLTTEERSYVDNLFDTLIFPVLTPLAVDPAHPFPYISGLSLNLGVLLTPPSGDTEVFARIKVPQILPRFINVSSDQTHISGDMATSGNHTSGDAKAVLPARFLPIEDLIAAHLGSLFTGMTIVGHSVFRVTRNEDLEVEEDDAENLLKALEKELLERRFGPAVRLEVTPDLHPRMRRILLDELGVADSEIYELPAPLDLSGLADIADLPIEDLHFPQAVPSMNRDLSAIESSDQVDIFSAVADHDILLHHPYDSFSTSVQAFLEQAASDPHVLAIKQTLYRTSGDSPIIDALIEAAQAGKQVLAVVEIKARFDEEANISWARKLERAGVHVVYGIVGLKTHAKLSLVVREESSGLVRYCHVGTGNYHPKTARAYEDLGLLSAHPEVGKDMSKLFNQLSGYAPQAEYSRLVVAPSMVRKHLLSLIEEQTRRAAAGEDARINIKLNSLVDEALIDALYIASQQGVKVRLLIRGICALRPGIPGLSENITVRSILGRYLEHSRIYLFGTDDSTYAFIGSADLMHRNLDRRVEALVRLIRPQHIQHLHDLFDLAFAEETSAFILDSTGTWHREVCDANGDRLQDYQTELIVRHQRRN